MINIPFFNNKKELNEFVDDWAKRNTISIDNRDWFFCVAIDNGKNRTLLTKSTIEALVIEDDLFEWYTKGYITITNDESSLERTVGPEKLLELVGMDPGYKIRGDGRDIISINITPKLSTLNSFIAKLAGLDKRPDEDIFKLSNDYVIYDSKTEYVEGEKQLKTFYFWDLRYQLLLERNVHYSTGLVKSKSEKSFEKEIRRVNNEDRSIDSGEAIKEFIKHSLEDQDPEFEDDLWDKGGTKIFYSSPAQYKGINDLDWLMDSHISDSSADNDVCILKYDTYIKKWTLMPISKYFEEALDGKDAGDYQFDRFLISDHDGPQNFIMKALSLIPPDPRAPKMTIGDINSKIKDPKMPLPKVGQIRRKNMTNAETAELEKSNWKFEDLAGVDNQTLLTTYAVHSYNMGTHEFNIDVYDNEIQKVYEKFSEKYIEKNFMGKKKPVPSFAITPGKKSRKVMNNLFTLSDEDKARAIKGRNQLYKNLIFLNNTCSVTCKGETHRRSGRFFSIDRNTAYFNNDFDNKILGQYFIVNVQHRLIGERYETEMLGVKPYRFEDVDYEREKIIE